MQKIGKQEILRAIDDLEAIRTELMHFANKLLEKLLDKLNRWEWDYIDYKLTYIINTLTQILNKLRSHFSEKSEQCNTK